MKILDLRKYSLLIAFLCCLSANSAFCQVKTRNPSFGIYLDSLFQPKLPPLVVSEVKELKKQGIVLLDVREKDEFEVSHIRHALHTSALWFDMRQLYDLPLDTTIVIYCSVGNRAQRIGERIKKAGYSKVYFLYGGIFEWLNQGNPVYRKDGVQTTEIHIYQPQWSQWLEAGTKVGL